MEGDETVEEIVPQSTYECTDCDRKFVSKNSLSQHMRSHTGKMFQCKLCDYRNTGKSAFTIHMSTHSEPTHKCNKCGEKFMKLRELSAHLRRFKCIFKCNFCEYKETGIAAFTIHMNPHPNAVHECNLCDYRNTRITAFLIHKKTHSERTKEPIHECNICGRKFLRGSALSIHMRTHKGKIFECNYCNYKNTGKTAFTIHVKTHEATLKDYLHECNQCDRKFKNTTLLETHMRAHNARIFSCKLWDYQGTTNRSYKIHLRTHAGRGKVIPNHCSACNIEFNDKESLNIHNESAHEGVTVLKCHHCDRKFSHNGGFTRHLRTHRKKTFSCKLCDFQIIGSKKFNIHMKKHKTG